MHKIVLHEIVCGRALFPTQGGDNLKGGAIRDLQAPAMILRRSVMVVGRRFLLVAVPLALVVSFASSQGAPSGSWDGAWTGSLEHVSALSLKIANDKVVSYAIAGAPVAVRYTKATPTTLSFGDRDHFSVTLTRTGATTASAKAHGRSGFGSGLFTKQ
jgi:hypothetical protein